jgi:LPXTG-site transpeptidase (sortase) family protein
VTRADLRACTAQDGFIVGRVRLPWMVVAETESSRSRRRRSPSHGGPPGRGVIAVMAIAAIVGVVALVFALRPVPAEAPFTPSAPPLALPSGGSIPATARAAGEIAAVRVEAPSGGINLGLVEGDGVHVPLNLAAHYPGTAEPGSTGNAVYYAHAQPGMFQGLYRLRLGDVVRVFRQDGSELVFHVAAFKKVSYNDRSVLLPTPFNELTLLTCTSYDPFTPRFIVIAT